MTVIQKPRRSRGLKSMRAAVVAGAAVIGVVIGSGSAQAAVDNSNSIVDGGGNTISVSAADTFINSVFPLDGNPLTREWFQNGRVAFTVAGPDAADFSGKLSIGYQVGFPAAFAPTITFQYTTPNLDLTADANGISEESLSGLFPQVAFSAPISSGGGIKEVEAASGDVTGDSGSVQLSNFHGTVTGVLGNVTIRPYVKLVSSKGDIVVSYGAPWRLN